jgi:hypothetical protein
LFEPGKADRDARGAGIGVAIARYPAHALVASCDRAAEVDAPGVVARVERQRLERNRNLGHPALLVDARRGRPNTLPLPLFVGDVLVQRFLAQAVGIGLKAIAAAPIVERIEDHREPVVAEHLFALAQDSRRDVGGAAVVEARADVQIVGVVHHVDDRPFARGGVFGRLDLVKVIDRRCEGPGFLVEYAVDDRRGRRAHDPERLFAAAFGGALLCERRQGAQRAADQKPSN